MESAKHKLKAIKQSYRANTYFIDSLTIYWKYDKKCYFPSYLRRKYVFSTHIRVKTANNSRLPRKVTYAVRKVGQKRNNTVLYCTFLAYVKCAFILLMCYVIMKNS